MVKLDNYLKHSSLLQIIPGAMILSPSNSNTNPKTITILLRNSTRPPIITILRRTSNRSTLASKSTPNYPCSNSPLLKPCLTNRSSNNNLRCMNSNSLKCTNSLKDTRWVLAQPIFRLETSL